MPGALRLPAPPTRALIGAARAGLGALLLLALVRPAPACRLVELTFRPALDDLQIVIWLETADGQFLETLFMTDKTGRYGLGNRPGRFDFNSEFRWPYGRRVTTFPYWAGRSPKTYPKLIFQDGDDDDLSHGTDISSRELFYCRPLDPDGADAVYIDAMTCASGAVYTDKGTFHQADGTPVAETSKYPPRNDVAEPAAEDHADVAQLAALNDLDAVSQATPRGGVDRVVLVERSDELPDGDYVAFIEVSREFDQNAFYDYASPEGIPWSEYGRAYRGQPSLVWRVPFTIGPQGGVFGVTDYAGYGDPAGGAEGVLSPPDETINQAASRIVGHTPGDGVTAASRLWTLAAGGFTQADVGRTMIVSGSGTHDGAWTVDQVPSTTQVVTVEAVAADAGFGAGAQAEVLTPGSGALRLETMADGRRFRVEVTSGNDALLPGAPTNVRAAELTPSSARIEFTAPGDDGAGGAMVTGYEIRYRLGEPLTEETFLMGTAIAAGVTPTAPGTTQRFDLTGLEPQAYYWVGIRALDECLNAGALTVFQFVTPAYGNPSVSSCACRAGGRSRAAWAPALAALMLLLGRRRLTK